MTQKGFTLVELLAVIVLMAILITVAVPGITRIGRSLKVQSFCSKIKIIESAALEYANDYYSGKEVAGSKVSLDNVSLMDLVNMGYLKGDNDLKSASNLTDKEKEDKANGKKFCILYDKDSNCLKDPRDDSSMDYKLVKIWSANNRLYASFRYTKDDADNNICGDAINYEIDNTTNDFTKSIVYESELGDFKNQTRATIPMENGIYSWSNYKNYRIIRKDYIPGNYYIQSITIQYKLGPQTRLELSSGDLFSNNTIVSGNSEYSNYYVFNALNDKYLSNIDLAYRVAVNNETRVSNAYGKIINISVTWAKIT